ncbi:YceI family protein [Marinobacter sp. VGCF2001]|uniref:YceI family protein n=1 Tax=Marinobacter sp. VGCF2001 TaxID=3417189 RepID=UPI003CF34122
MKRLFPDLLASSLLLVAATAAHAEPATFEVDEEHFSMSFEIMHIGYAPVIGMFRDIEGNFEYDEETGELNSGRLVFQADSVFTNHDKRDDHLREPDFLNAREHPEIVFSVNDFVKTGDNTGVVTGDLTMLGQTRPVDVDVTLNKAAEYPIGHEEYTLGISAEAIINRSEWGMTYAVENGLVGDEVRLRFGFEAIRQGGGWF